MAQIKSYTWRAAVMALPRKQMESSTRLVIVAIAESLNDTEGLPAFPSEATIADRCGMTEKTVRDHIKKATDSGWLRVTQSKGAGQAWRRNEYHPLIPKGCEKGPVVGAEPSLVRDEREGPVVTTAPLVESLSVDAQGAVIDDEGPVIDGERSGSHYLLSTKGIYEVKTLEPKDKSDPHKKGAVAPQKDPLEIPEPEIVAMPVSNSFVTDDMRARHAKSGLPADALASFDVWYADRTALYPDPDQAFIRHLNTERTRLVRREGAH